MDSTDYWGPPHTMYSAWHDIYGYIEGGQGPYISSIPRINEYGCACGFNEDMIEEDDYLLIELVDEYMTIEGFELAYLGVFRCQCGKLWRYEEH